MRQTTLRHGAARQIETRLKGTIATVLPDRAERYFSTALL
jgi:cysteine synthase A